MKLAPSKILPHGRTETRTALKKELQTALTR